MPIIFKNRPTVALIPILSVLLKKLGMNTTTFPKDLMITKRLKNFSGPTNKPREGIVNS